MYSVDFPTDKSDSQLEVLKKLGEVTDPELRAHLRALVPVTGEQRVPICGRIDIARDLDIPQPKLKPSDSVSLLQETIDLDTLLARLESALAGDALVIGGVPLLHHGMDSRWGCSRSVDDFSEYRSSWPLVRYAPSEPTKSTFRFPGAIAAEGERGAFDGLSDCIAEVMGFPNSGLGIDLRFSRFQIEVWDYRGTFRISRVADTLEIKVEPPDDPDLMFSFVAYDERDTHRASYRQPSIVEVAVVGCITRLNASLTHRGQLVCERLITQRSTPSLASELVSRQSIVADVALGFVRDVELRGLIARDLDEFDRASAAGASKAAVLLAGSVIESALLDVLGRNQKSAVRLLGKKWPERASLKDLITACSQAEVLLPNGSTVAILPPLTSTKGMIVIDHRDLIHPRAEIRGAVAPDSNTVTTMRGVVGEILRDLAKADADGVLARYEGTPP
ncbi:MAG: hypothetical protein AB7K71_04385 [Polyangiaceae bacterium]